MYDAGKAGKPASNKGEVTGLLPRRRSVRSTRGEPVMMLSPSNPTDGGNKCKLDGSMRGETVGDRGGVEGNSSGLLDPLDRRVVVTTGDTAPPDAFHSAANSSQKMCNDQPSKAMW